MRGIRKCGDRKVAPEVTRKARHQIKRSPPDALAALAAANDEGIDTSDIPERTGRALRIERDAKGRIHRAGRSMIRAAILAEIKRRGIAGHQLWIEARKRCGTIPESAVYEFLSGKRQVGLAYLDAMLEALEWTISPRT